MEPCYICRVSQAPGCGRRHLSGCVLEFLGVDLPEKCFLCKECFRKAQRGSNCQATARNILSELQKLQQTRVQSEEKTETAVRDLLLVDACTQTTFEDIYPTCETATPSH